MKARAGSRQSRIMLTILSLSLVLGGTVTLLHSDFLGSPSPESFSMCEESETDTAAPRSPLHSVGWFSAPRLRQLQRLLSQPGTARPASVTFISFSEVSYSYCYYLSFWPSPFNWCRVYRVGVRAPPALVLAPRDACTERGEHQPISSSGAREPAGCWFHQPRSRRARQRARR